MPSTPIRGFAVENAIQGCASLRLQFQSDYSSAFDPSSSSAIEILVQEAEACRRLGHLVEARRLFRTALVHSGLTAFDSGRCWSIWGLGMLLRSEGRFARCKLFFREAYEAARQAGDARCMLWSRAELAETDRIIGRYQDAIEAHLLLRISFHEIGDMKGVCWATSGIGQVYRIAHAYDTAASAFQQSLSISQDAGDVLSSSWSIRGLAEVARERHEYEVAIDLATSARANFASAGYSLGAAYAAKTVADALLAAGRVVEARTMARLCAAEFAAVGENRGIALSLLTLSTVSACLGEQEIATQQARDSASRMRRTGLLPPDGFNPHLQLDRLLSQS